MLVIKIPVSNNVNRPFMVKTQIKYLKENEIYIRKGSTTALANKKDLEYMFKENKNSKLIIQSYLDGNLSDKIQLSEVNSKIEKYKQDKFKKLKQLVDDINKLKGNDFSFGTGLSFLISDEVVEIGFFEDNDADLRYQDEIQGALILQIDKAIDLIYLKYLKALIHYEGVQRIEEYMFPRERI